MPIRTPRGRSAAYRALWPWPLRSPARLAVTAACLVALIFAIMLGVGATARPASSPTSPGPTTVAGPAEALTPEPTALPPVAELTPTTLPLSAAPAAGLRVAANWAKAWVRPADGTTSARWLDGLRPTTTDEYLGVLAGVDPSNIPATKVTGTAKAIEVFPRSMRVQVPTDALTLVVTVVDTDTGWRVSGYDRS